MQLPCDLSQDNLTAISIRYLQLISENSNLEEAYLSLVTKSDRLKDVNADLRRVLEEMQVPALQRRLQNAAQALGQEGWTVNQVLSEVGLNTQGDSCNQLESMSIRLYTTLKELVQRLGTALKDRKGRVLVWEKHVIPTYWKIPLDTTLCRLFLQPGDTAKGTTAEGLVTAANESLRDKVRTLLNSLMQAMDTLHTEANKRKLTQISPNKRLELGRIKTENSALHTDSTLSEDLSESTRRVSPLKPSPRPSPRARVIPSPRRFASAPRVPSQPLNDDQCELEEELLLQSFRISLKQHSRPSFSIHSALQRPTQVKSKSNTDIRSLQRGLAKVRKMELEANRSFRSGTKGVNFPFLRSAGRG